MPLYVRAEALEVPSPSLSEVSDGFYEDPELVFPERKGKDGIIKNVMSEIFNNTWQHLEEKETEKGKYK